MERVQALRGKLPQALLWEIQKFDAHPAADLVRELRFTQQGEVTTVATSRGYFLNKWRELQRRLASNKTYKQTGASWQIIDFEVHLLYWTHMPCLYINHPDTLALADWVVEDFLCVHLLDRRVKKSFHRRNTHASS